MPDEEAAPDEALALAPPLPVALDVTTVEFAPDGTTTDDAVVAVAVAFWAAAEEVVLVLE